VRAVFRRVDRAPPAARKQEREETAVVMMRILAGVSRQTTGWVWLTERATWESQMQMIRRGRSTTLPCTVARRSSAL